MTTWLTLDVGNSHSEMGLWVQGNLLRRSVVTTEYGSSMDLPTALMEAGRHLTNVTGASPIERVICSSVVPANDEIVAGAFAPVPCLFISHEHRREFEINLEDPSQMGADRLANMAAAVRMGPAPMIIVDAGTATAFCVLNERRTWVGGAIAPGAALGLEALSRRAAKLPRVVPQLRDSSVGSSTMDQMVCGACKGHEAMIEGLTERMLTDTDLNRHHVECIATGGCLNFLNLSPKWRIVPDLVHHGCYIYGTLNPEPIT